VSKQTWWQKSFATSDGDISVARLHITWGACLLFGCIAPFLADRADSPILAVPPFIEGLIILSVGGAAIIVEARIERVSDIASLPELPVANSDSSPRPRYWFDIAVLQLLLGAVVVPLLSFAAALQTIGWRLVIITIVSELVYLAFLSVQLVHKGELIALFAALRETKESMTAAETAVTGSPDEHLLQKKGQEQKLQLLRDRIKVLMQLIGRTFARAAEPSG
jgi:hypothetical protein